MRKARLIALATYAASPQGRRRILQAKRWLDTPANRRRAAQMTAQMKDKVLAQRRPRA